MILRKSIHRSKLQLEFRPKLYKTRKCSTQPYSPHGCLVLSLKLQSMKSIDWNSNWKIDCSLPSTNVNDGMYRMTGRKKKYTSIKVIVVKFRIDGPNRNSKYWNGKHSFWWKYATKNQICVAKLNSVNEFSISAGSCLI